MKNQNTPNTGIESKKTASAGKRRRMSLAVQVNLLIVAITLGISLLLVAISAADYRRAILDPFTIKLSEYEVKEEETLRLICPTSPSFSAWKTPRTSER